jgi:hypothetical protein
MVPWKEGEEKPQRERGGGGFDDDAKYKMTEEELAELNEKMSVGDEFTETSFGAAFAQLEKKNAAKAKGERYRAAAPV